MKILKYIIINLLVGWGVQCGAQASSDSVQFILTQTIDNEIKLYSFSNTSRFIVLPDETFVINNIESQNTEIDLKKISAFGIIIGDANASTIDDTILDDITEHWSIFSNDGILLFSGSGGSIPYESLQKGLVYIIKFRNKTYKYFSL